MLTALVIGFGPFPGAPRNPSVELVRRLAKRRRPSLAGTRAVTHILPTSYAAVNEELPALLRQHDPDVVLFFGLASRTPYLRIEQRAANRATGFYADASRTKYATRALTPGLPPEQHVRADARRLLSVARAARIDARLSRDAGRYICNAAFYRTLHTSGQQSRPRLVAFVHIPRPRQRARLDGRRGRRRPSMDALVRAGEAILADLVAQASILPARVGARSARHAGGG
jgi:pyroglutamyl-peptidase